MIILDTNVLSDIMQTEPTPQVVEWLDSVPAESIWITSITLFEARFGLALLPEGKKRELLQALFEELLEKDLERRVLFFDTLAANHAAKLAAKRQNNGCPVDMRDTFIAGIALAKKATIATRNVRHFNDLDVEIINPWGNGVSS